MIFSRLNIANNNTSWFIFSAKYLLQEHCLSIVQKYRWASIIVMGICFYLTLFFWNSIAMPPVRALTELTLYFISVSKLQVTEETSMPRFLKSCCAMCKRWELWSKAFDGMQPTFKHVPPRVGSFSTHTVCNEDIL